jgi:hypothetical protein
VAPRYTAAAGNVSGYDRPKSITLISRAKGPAHAIEVIVVEMRK